MKKTLILLILILILIQIANAEVNCEGTPENTICYEDRGETYNSSTPTIIADYHELPVTIQEAYLINTETNTKTELNTEYEDGIKFEFKPKYHLGNNKYTLVLNATDQDENVVTMYVNFTIESPVIDVWVREPQNRHVQRQNFAVGNNTTFKLQLELERPGLCAFSRRSLEGNESLSEIFSRLTKFQPDGISGYLNSIQNFNMQALFQGYQNDGELHSLYLVCREQGSDKYTTKEIKVGTDLTPTDIQLKAAPHPILDYERKTTNITIKTDDYAACTVKNVNPPENGAAIQFENPQGTIFTSLTDFKKDYEEKIYLPPQNPTRYEYILEIICDNVANYRTTNNFTIQSDLQVTQQLDFLEPQKIINSKNYNLTIALNIQDFCTYTTNTSDVESYKALTFSNYTDDGKAKYVAQGEGTEGENKVYVNCTLFQGYKEYDFIIDTTPPPAPTIEANQYTCNLDKIEATITGEDDANGTGIETYHYNITYMDQTLNITPQIGHTNEMITENIEYDMEGEQIIITAYAQDKAGNNGTKTTRTMTVSNSTIPECDFESPELNLTKTKNNETNEWTIIVGCEDNVGGSGCLSTFYHSTHQTEENCTYSKQSSLGTPIKITQTSKVCIAIYDLNQNNKTHVETLTVLYPMHCFNEEQDIDETDIDCGGSCTGCQLNQTCAKNSDCEEKYCAQDNTCQIPSCSDGQKNGEESDIDCGRTCPTSCDIGKICDYDDDCSSLNCNNNRCEAPSCTNNKKDGKETDIDCGGTTCSPCEEGRICVINQDCQTKYCAQDNTCQIDPAQDTDRDGLPDYWELENFACETCAEPDDDFDDDGYTNLEEFTADTNPLSETSHPDFYKPIIPQIIMQIISVILILTGIVTLVLETQKRKKEEQIKQEQEYKQELSKGPKPIIVKKEPEKAKLSPEEEKKRQEQRQKAVTERKQKRREIFNEFTKEK